MRHLVIVLGDQLNSTSSAFDGFDPALDAVWMAEAASESTYAWSSKQRTVLFLSAMRHFAQALRADGVTVHYRALDDADNQDDGTLGGALAQALQRHRPQALICTEPGEWRLRPHLQAAGERAGVPLHWREDRHFLCTVDQFRAHAAGQRELRMEYFYREQRALHGVLMEGDRPCGGQWNYDRENRRAFGAQGPGFLPEPVSFAPDAVTLEVMTLVQARMAYHPGRLESFCWPVTRAQALEALRDFIDHRLVDFGHWQDAMWPGAPWLYHSRVSAALNLKLLDPREVIGAAEAAWRAGRVPLPAAEGYIRQILGWREYVRGIYWTGMPGYLQRNGLQAHEALPAWYWTGDTEMRCLREVLGQTLRLGYAHHIQRLMVAGLYAMLLGVDPYQVHQWFLAVYVDAVEWVEAPNTIGMSQYADGGLMASKPYAASGRYIERMSGYCAGCRFDPGERTGERACPFTTLYWDFLLRHAGTLQAHRRIAPQVRGALALARSEREAIAVQAAQWKKAARGGL